MTFRALFLGLSFSLFGSGFVIADTTEETSCPNPISDEPKPQELLACIRALQKEQSRGLPPGIVVAFDLRKCPPGWAQFGEGVGKFVVGAGAKGRLDPTRNGRSTGESVDLPEHAIGDQGGASETQLTLKHVPSHYHHIQGIGGPDDDGRGTGIEGRNYAAKNGGNIGVVPTMALGSTELAAGFDEDADGRIEAGEAKAFNNMPPYIALQMCKKCESADCKDEQ